jgi:hypothetical protein
MNKIYLFNRLRHIIFGEKFYKKLNFDWDVHYDRIKIIQNIINKNKFNSYLEIGCFNDDCFSKIKIAKKIGVDPFSGGNVRMTSDEFFNINKEKFDCIFVDGLHIYEQVKKDITNSLRFLNNNGVILVHDCLPENIFEQAVPRSKRTFKGDSWKAIVEMRTRIDVDTYTCVADEGLGVILKRKNNNLLCIKQKNFKKLSFKDYYYNYLSYMNIITVKDLFKLI